MPDPSSQSMRDSESKEKLKCEIVQFLIRTAREFATRQTKADERGRINACHIRGFSRSDFNGIWPRLPFDNDSQPCFKSGNFYLYYRSTTNQWVIDDVIEPTGAAFSRSSNEDLMSPWKSMQEWEDNPSMRVRKVRDGMGYQGLLQ